MFLKQILKSHNLPNNEVLSLTVGRTLSFALSETNNANGTIHRHKVKYAKIFNIINK